MKASQSLSALARPRFPSCRISFPRSVLVLVATPRQGSAGFTVGQLVSMEKSGFTTVQSTALLPIIDDVVWINTASTLDEIVKKLDVRRSNCMLLNDPDSSRYMSCYIAISHSLTPCLLAFALYRRTKRT